MKNAIKSAAFALAILGTVSIANAQTGFYSKVVLRDPVASGYSNNNQGHWEDRNSQHDFREIENDRAEFQHGQQIANALQQRIQADYILDDIQAANCDKERLERTNRRLDQLHHEIEREEREIREHEEREHHRDTRRW